MKKRLIDTQKYLASLGVKSHVLLFMLGLMVLTAWNLHTQFMVFKAEADKTFESTHAYLKDILRDFSLHLDAMRRMGSHVQFEQQSFEVLLEHTQAALPLSCQLGVVTQIDSPKVLKELISTYHQAGFENFKPKHQLLLMRYIPEKRVFEPYQFVSGQQRTLITRMFPYTPEGQALLGELIEAPDSQTTTALVQMAHREGPTLLHIRKSHLNKSVVLLLDLQTLLQPLRTEQLLGKYPRIWFTDVHGHLLFQPPLAQDIHQDTVLFNYALTRSINFFDMPLNFHVNFAWRLEDINFYSLLFSLLVGGGVMVLVGWLFKESSIYYNALVDASSRLQQLKANAHDAMITTTATGEVLDWSAQAEHIFEVSKDEAVGKNISLFMDKSFQQLLEAFEKQHEIILEICTDSGKSKVLRVSLTPLALKDGKEYLLIVQDITQEQAKTEQIQKMAFYDSLTGLESRVYFQRQLSTLMREDPTLKGGLLFLDLDGFKQVNDTMGHDAGDELLKIVAQRLRRLVPQVDRYHHLARFGGDEFLIFVPVHDKQMLTHLAKEILKSLSRPIILKKGNATVSASIGIVLYPEDGHTFEDLQRRADGAMYEAKKAGKNTFVFYDMSIEAALRSQMQLENALRHAVQQKSFYLVYQPKVNAETFALEGFEALIRWEDPNLGFVPPDKFIPLAENSNLIIKIGQWVIETAIAQLKVWADHPHLHNQTIAINLSGKQLIQPKFFENLADRLRQEGLSPQRLHLEITEHSLMSSADEHIKQMEAARELGFAFAVDDFGTGHSSLAYLKRLPIHTLKIDRSFVKDLPDDEEDKVIASTIISMARSLKLATVAEGVETESQVHWLQQQRCDTFQGYYFSKPLKVDEIEAWLAAHQQRFGLG